MTYNVEHAEHAWLNIAQSDLNSIKNPLIDLTQKQLVLSASISILEIWDKVRYESELNKKVNFGNLAEEVMGKRLNDES